MGKIPGFRSAPLPPPPPFKQVTLRNDATAAEKLTAVRSLLTAGDETRNRLYATKVGGETVLYVAHNAKQTGGLEHDRGYKSYDARAKLARQEIGDIYRACVENTLGGDTTAKGHQHHPDLLSERPDSGGTTRKSFFKGLLGRAIDKATDTEERPAGFATADNANGGGRSISSATMAFVRSVGLATGFITAPRARDLGRDMGVWKLDALDKAITNFTNRFERHAEAYTNHLEAHNRAPPPFPQSNAEEMLLPGVKLDGLEQSYPILKIDGQEFRPAKKLGSGGFGQVLRYEGVETGETKVVKLAKAFLENPDISAEANGKNREKFLAKQNRDAATELDAGRKYGNGGSVIGFTDHVKMRDGTVALIGDDVKGESVGGFSEKLQDAVAAGLIGRHEARLVALTLTKDAVDGIVALKQNGAVHGDMKPGNQIVDSDGRVRLIDLGMTQSGPVFRRAGLQANNTYNSPEAEFIRAANPNHDREAMYDNALADLQYLAAIAEYDEAFEFRDLMFTTYSDKYAAMQLDGETYAIDNRADVFGAGVTLMEMFTGASPYDWRAHEYLVRKYGEEAALHPTTDQLNDAKAFLKIQKVEASKSQAMGGVYGDDANPGFTTREAGQWTDKVIDALLNDMIAPNRERRIKPEDIANHSAMRYGAHDDGTAAVGSPEVRELIKAIASGAHPDAIMLEGIRLKNAHPQTEAFEDPLPVDPPVVEPPEIDLPPPPSGPPPTTVD